MIASQVLILDTEHSFSGGDRISHLKIVSSNQSAEVIGSGTSEIKFPDEYRMR